jgi:hypothetical protein
MRSLPKIERWEAEYVYTHIRVAHLVFRSSNCDQVAQVAFRAEVAPVVVEVHPCLCASSVSVDSLLSSAKCKSVWKQHAILPDTPGDLTSASKYF